MSQSLDKAGARRTAAFAIMLAAFVLVVLRSDSSSWLDRLCAPLNLLTARATAAVLGWGGLPVQRESMVLIHGGFVCEIYYACTGLVPATILSLAIAAFPSGFRQKLSGLCIGVPAVFLVNLVRMVSVFLTGVYFPGAFYLVHNVMWNIIWIVFTAGFFICWVRYVVAQEGHVESCRPGGGVEIARA